MEEIGGRCGEESLSSEVLTWSCISLGTTYVMENKKEARLRFVEPVSLFFDTFPDYARYEVVPMFWDCWPCYFEKTCEWLRRHQVKTAIISSRQTAEKCKNVSPGRTWNGKE